MKTIFTKRDLGYPSGYTDFDDIYDLMEAVILAEGGYSSDYGFRIEEIADFIDKISPNELFKR
jgi:hypothetical protein